MTVAHTFRSADVLCPQEQTEFEGLWDCSSPLVQATSDLVAHRVYGVIDAHGIGPGNPSSKWTCSIWCAAGSHSLLHTAF